MMFDLKGRGAEPFDRLLLRAWRGDIREHIRFRVEIIGDQGVLVMNPEIKRVRPQKCLTHGNGDVAVFAYDLASREPEELLNDLTSFVGCQQVRLRMISRPGNREIALLNEHELNGLAKCAAGNDSKALLPFVFPERSDWRVDVHVRTGSICFRNCQLWLPGVETKRLLLDTPGSSTSLCAVRCGSLVAELPTVSFASSTPIPLPGESCPHCCGQFGSHEDGRLACRLRGSVLQPETVNGVAA